MKIGNLYAYPHNVNYLGKSKIKAKQLGAITTGIAAAFHQSKNCRNDEDNSFLYENLEDIEETDDNIFDEEYYQAYYNIDLNLANNRAFRDDELFNPLRDDEHYGYKGYDGNDIRPASNLVYKNDINEYTTRYKLSDTDFGDMKLPPVITDPEKTQSDDLKILDRYVKLNKRVKQLKIGDYAKNAILETCRRMTDGFYDVDFELVNIALDLYENEKTWFGANATGIINILKKYDTDSDEYKYLCNFINAGILAHQSNDKIYAKILKKSKQYDLQ